MERTLFTEDHEAYRETVREFVAREVTPRHDKWEEARWIDRDVFPAAAAAGVYALQVPEKYGGAGESDYRYRVVSAEEIARAHATSFGVTTSLQDDLVLHYLLDLTNDEQKERFLPGFARGGTIGALAMTEPGAGSDLRGMRTTAVRDGDSFVLNGSKTFISSGIMADVVIVACKTDPDAGSKGITLFLVEDGMDGFVRGRKLDKIGLPGQDTAELFFEDVRVPRANLLGEEGRGLHALMSHLPRERLGVSLQAISAMTAVYEDTVAYCRTREAYGEPLTALQHVRFELAELATEIDVARAYFDASVLAYNAGRLSDVDAAKGKWWISELAQKVINTCLQLHGGFGYMREYPVARAWTDARVQTIYGGTTAVMKEIIGRQLAR
ncbi:acyl-CoA dehydrogenase [Nocardioides immobilis]|uniref:Acyl-CoA dehydrogenase n=1 Tax=Nocardioides immobilis TaxID=2049295 RepID=A0A417XZD3_9ACTN|nr:acyl-CoA dehydrogenase family protein [Nocardioides immobilis]RHW25738.1 acyl-CoA dehydrogenase [Nocardioides immobilis]